MQFSTMVNVLFAAIFLVSLCWDDAAMYRVVIGMFWMRWREVSVFVRTNIRIIQFGLCMAATTITAIYYLVQQRTYRQLLRAQSLLPETVREHSPLMTSKHRSFQVAVGFEFFGKFEVLGSAFRIDNYLVAPTHVVARDTMALKYQKEVLAVTLSSDDWIEIAADVSVYPIPARSVLNKISKAKVAQLRTKTMVSAECSLQNNNKSYGLLMNSANGFGLTEYTGSTLAGFSGGVYMACESVVGMHLGGGAVNYGVNMAYILNKIRRLSQVPEDSDYEAIANAFRDLREDEDWEFNTAANPDEVEVRVGGQYFLVDREMKSKITKDFFLDDYYYAGKNRKTRSQYQPESAFDWERLDKMLDAKLKMYERVPESNEAFLGEPGSSMQEDLSPIERRLENIESTIDTLMSKIQMVTVGQEQIAKLYDDRLKSMQNSELEQMLSIKRSVEENLSGRFSAPIRQIESELDALRTQMTQLSTNISTCSSEHATFKQQLASASSRPTRPSSPRSDGMASVLQKYQEWRNSNSTLNPDFVNLRTRFLEQLSLSMGQAQWLVSNHIRICKTKPLLVKVAMAGGAEVEIPEPLEKPLV